MFVAHQHMPPAIRDSSMCRRFRKFRSKSKHEPIDNGFAFVTDEILDIFQSLGAQYRMLLVWVVHAKNSVDEVEAALAVRVLGGYIYFSAMDEEIIVKTTFIVASEELHARDKQSHPIPFCILVFGNLIFMAVVPEFFGVIVVKNFIYLFLYGCWELDFQNVSHEQEVIEQEHGERVYTRPSHFWFTCRRVVYDIVGIRVYYRTFSSTREQLFWRVCVAHHHVCVD